MLWCVLGLVGEGGLRMDSDDGVSGSLIRRVSVVGM